MNVDNLPDCWRTSLADEFSQSRFQQLQQFVSRERQSHDVFPREDDVFNALRLTPLNDVRVLILGQDPYHDDGQAHGLSFSVQRGIKIPPSLRNMFKELQADLEIPPAEHGCLEAWAKQGVLLLNTVLTVRAHEANSHRKQGWEEFTDRIIACVNELPAVAFVLWGKPAQKKADLIDSRHLVIQSPHPSPLSARRGFFGSRPFSKINSWLEEHDMLPIDWRLEALSE
ncbi:uracil-DNA glycosylase [Fuerstiella marisgermanici]|uniref:Uracil-DNA glycosylase n=1 Tax=Fuerstiella marisgermanici TaxID=1891926 RepID=A0A1P8WMA2_9PLAN|nr:uracil-DNA glycosylase [Fuerstiella marisgermanici]APZ95193.1 Uracil-DNA glycosylase [Fuerstiella marisgermanici]